MARITINGRAYDIRDGQNLLSAALELGFDLPYFCWHPAFGAIGACRQCAVKQFKDEHDTRGKIVMACLTAADDGVRISTDDPEAIAFRRAVIEWLMTNHPHDCPVCDEGGECHLQDMTVMTGHAYRRHRFRKRTYANQDLGPFVNHEMNRCIQCFRCERFYRDYARGGDLRALASSRRLYFGRERDGALESPFAGNLVEVCPTGVFTDKTLKQHYTRKWDLGTAPSICVHCGLGCNTIVGERYEMVRRIRNRFHPEINGYFICDRGRYGYEFLNGKARRRQSGLRDAQTQNPREVAADEALAACAEILRGAHGVIGIGSPRASLEANYALRALVGPDNFVNGLPAHEVDALMQALDAMQSGAAPSASVSDVEKANAVLMLGDDVHEVAPRLALAILQASRREPMRQAAALHIPEWNDFFVRLVEGRRCGPVHLITTLPSALDEHARSTRRSTPEDIALLALAIAGEIDPGASQPLDIDNESREAARAIARDLLGAEQPVVVLSVVSGSFALVNPAICVVQALQRRRGQGRLCLVVGECNTVGAALMERRALDEAASRLAGAAADTLVILENDVSRRMPADAWRDLCNRARHIVLLDHIVQPLDQEAEIVLPATPFSECTGTLVNHEGRIQRFFQVCACEAGVRPSWRWLAEMIARRDGVAPPWKNIAEIHSAIAADLPVFARISEAAPEADFRMLGMKIPRQTHRSSGRTSMWANLNVHEPAPQEDPDSPLAYSMEGYTQQAPPAVVAHYWDPGWNSVQALNKFQQEIGGPLRGGSPGIRIFPAAKGAERELQPCAPDVPDTPTAPPAAHAPAATPALPAAQPGAGPLRLLARFHVFGSEELSALGEAVASLVPQPYVALSPNSAAKMGLREGDKLRVDLVGDVAAPGAAANPAAGQRPFAVLPLRVIAGMPEQAAALPAGLPGLPSWGAARWVLLSRND